MDDVLIVGGGLSGLSCARALRRAGIACRVLEASDGVGGRVRTDLMDGFLLDRGFQVLLTAYPECQAQLEARKLDLKAFQPGALVRLEGKFHRVADPFRRPADALATLFSPIGTFGDKLKVARLRAEVCRGDAEALWQRPERPTLYRLREAGFSTGMIDRFFRPFFGGVLLDRELASSSRLFEFIFRMFSEGDTVVPAHGMGRISAQLAEGLDVELGAQVMAVEPTGVTLANGERRPARAVVVAVQGAAAAALVPALEAPGNRGVTCLYFAAERDPVGEPILLLDGEGAGPVNNFSVMSTVAQAYAPPGAVLCSASVLGVEAGPELEGAVRTQLGQWFGPAVTRWRHLRTYRIPEAQPVQNILDPAERPARVGELFVAGDHRTQASLQGALLSGRRAAEAVIAAFEEAVPASAA